VAPAVPIVASLVGVDVDELLLPNLNAGFVASVVVVVDDDVSFALLPEFAPNLNFRSEPALSTTDDDGVELPIDIVFSSFFVKSNLYDNKHSIYYILFSNRKQITLTTDFFDLLSGDVTARRLFATRVDAAAKTAFENRVFLKDCAQNHFFVTSA
jgi:hypothetical protein